MNFVTRFRGRRPSEDVGQDVPPVPTSVDLRLPRTRISGPSDEVVSMDRSVYPESSLNPSTAQLSNYTYEQEYPASITDRSIASSSYTSYDLPHPFHSDPSRAEAELPDALPSQGRLCIAIDFGTVLSGVACGMYTPGSVQQILWPGSNRKIPTCLVYDDLGTLRAWGFNARNRSLRDGWIRCEMFKLHFDPALHGTNALPPLPPGKELIDLVTDYLTRLWAEAKQGIIREAGYTAQDLKSADIWISIPAIWSVESGELMREAAFRAGLVAHQKSTDYSGGRDRLHLIAEPEAAAAHCAGWNDPNLRPGQIFMVCDAGGGTIDTAIYQFLGTLTQVAERCASSGSSCGSHFLDLAFRAYLEQWHRSRNIHLTDDNLTHYMHSFTYTQKLEYRGEEEDANAFYFECYDSRMYPVDPSPEFAYDQLIVPGYVLRTQIFDPVVTQVLAVLEAQLSKERSTVEALLLVGGFSGSPYLNRCIHRAFRTRIPYIYSPIDADIATSLGAVKSGMQRGLVRRPQTGPTIIAPQSYIIRVELPASAEDRRLQGAYIQRDRLNVEICRSRTKYLVIKGALLKKGEPVLKKVTKIVEGPHDYLFIANFFSSDRAEMEQYVNGGDLTALRTWEIDLSNVPLFRQYARNPHPQGIKINFDLGIEIDSVSARAVWYYERRRGGVFVLRQFA